MYRNYNDITPKSPTELPIDYDHLSMDPQKPGDGIAAGWMKRVELREDGDELWAEVEWTKDGAARIKNQEYRFVSPSFTKDHTHKETGKKIGATLLAAAITNHPFLEGMKALTLYNFSAMGDVALNEGTVFALSDKDRAAAESQTYNFMTWDECIDKNQDKDDPKAFCGYLKAKRDGTLNASVHLAKDQVINLPFAEYEDFDDCVSKNGSKDNPQAFCGWLKHRVEGSTDPVDMVALNKEWDAVSVINLAELGQRVMIAPGNARTQDEIGGTFEVSEVVGDGDDAFVSVKDAAGLVHKWFRATELLPASSTPANPAAPALQPGSAPVVPVQPTSQATDPAAAAAAALANAAKPVMSPAAPVPPSPSTPPGAPQATAANHPGADSKPKMDGPKPFFAKPADGQKTDGQKPDFGQKTDGQKPSGDKKDEDDKNRQAADLLKKVFAGLVSANSSSQEGNATMAQKFMLHNDKGQPIEITAEQLEKAGIKMMPEGSTAVPNSELAEMKSTITNLSETVTTMRSDAEATAKKARADEVTRLLSEKLRGGFIPKPLHDTLLKQYVDAVDLSGLKDILATFTTPIVALNREHGSSAEGETKPQGEAAQEKLMNLTNQYVKERNMTYADAAKAASMVLKDEVEQYREHYATH